MFIFNKEQGYIFFDTSKFNSDEEMYEKLWNEMYNVTISKEEENTVQDIVDYINNDIFLI